MSRWGVVALTVAAATVIGIGMVALRLSEPSAGDADVESAGRAAPTSSTDAADRPADAARPRDRGDERSRSRRGEPSVRTQLRRLRRSLARRDEPAARTDFFVTVSLRKPLPLPLTIADRRPTPLPDELPDTTAYTLYTETGSGQRRARTTNLGDAGPLDGVPPKRVVLLGMSWPLDDYRAVEHDLRALPIGTRDVTVDGERADYLSDQAYGDAAIRSWSRYYRRVQRTA